MQIRLDQIGDQPYTWNQTRSILAPELERGGLTDLGPVIWRGEIRRVVADFLLHAQLSYEQTSTCSRCLEPAIGRVDETLELLIQIEEEAAKEEEESEIELTEDDMGVLTLAGPQYDLEPLMREQMQLSVPMRPLCRAECRGLCPQCGANLNLEACACDREKIDPRWAGLAALKGRLVDGEADS